MRLSTAYFKGVLNYLGRNNAWALLKAKINLVLKKLWASGVTTTVFRPASNL